MIRIGLVVAGVIVAASLIALAVMVRSGAPTSAPSAAPPSEPAPRHAEASGTVVTPEAGSSEPHRTPAVATSRVPGGAGDRETILDALRESGAAKEAWNAQATTLLATFASGSLEHTTTECFSAGCASTVTFANDEAYRHRAVELVAADAFHAWTGGKRFSVPEHVGDHVVVAFVLYRPD